MASVYIAEDESAKELRYLLDEDVSPNIVATLWDDGIDSVPLRNRNKLQLPDFKVMQLASKENRAVVTINEADFERIVKKLANHSGVVTIPSGGSRDEQAEFIRSASEWPRTHPHAMAAIKNKIVAVNEDHAISARFCFAPPAMEQPVLRVVLGSPNPKDAA